MPPFRTNTSPLGATRVATGVSLLSALYLGNVISVCWQGVPAACCCRLMTHRGWVLHQSAISRLSLRQPRTVMLPLDRRSDGASLHFLPVLNGEVVHPTPFVGFLCEVLFQ